MVCSLFREKSCNPALSGIRIKKVENEWVKRETPVIYEVHVCKQCGICINACPVDAIGRDPETGAVFIIDEKCIRCKKCVEECPFDAIWYEVTADKMVKCDLCMGVASGPKCIEWCALSVLRLVKK